MKITQLAPKDLNYGDIGIVQVGDTYVLIDAGILGDRDNIAQAINDAPIHTAIISHWHEDHVGSFRQLNYGRLMFGNSSQSWEQPNKSARKKDIEETAERCNIKVPPHSIFIDKEGDERSQSFGIESKGERAIFQCISPATVPPRSADSLPSPPIPNAVDENHYSMLTAVMQGTFAFLSFGDITQDARFLNFDSFVLYVLENSTQQVIKLPHHGSARNCVELMDFFKSSGRIKPGCHFVIPGYSAQVPQTLSRFVNFFNEGADIYLTLLTRNREAYESEAIKEIRRKHPGRFFLGTRFDRDTR